MGEGGGDGRPLPLIISTGEAEANRQFFAEYKVSWPVLLQTEMEISTPYHASGTPSGYLIDAGGKIASELAVGAETLLALAEGKTESRKQKAEIEQRLLGPAHGNDNRDGPASRFGNRTLARSKIKRDGLKTGTVAPEFRLPRLDGGELALSELRGLLVLLVFSSPHCGPCNALAPKLEKFYRPKRRASRFGRSSARPAARRPGPAHSAHGREGDEAFGFELVMISRESPEANRAKVKEQGLTFPVVLQQQWEVSRSYAFFATPAAYLVDETGVIAADVAVGVDAVLELTTRAARMLRQDGKALRRPLLRRLTGWMAKAA